MQASDLNMMLNELLNLKLNESFIDVYQGVATYKMKRGSFETSDKISLKKHLIFTECIDDVYHFTDGLVNLYMSVTFDEYIHLSFEIDGNYNRLKLELTSFQDEAFFGCGEQFATFNLKGKKVDIWVSEHHSLKKLLYKYFREKLLGKKPDYVGKFKHHQTYFSQPTFISSKKYFVHAETNSFASFEFAKHKTILSFREIPKKIMIGYAKDFISLSSSLSYLLGKQPFLPNWTEKGAILAMQGGINNIREKIKSALHQDLKISGIWVQDWSGHLLTSFGYQVNWNWSLDQENYNNLPLLIEELKQQNIRFLGYINPFLKENSPLYMEALHLKYLVLNKEQKPYLVKSTTFDAGMIDLSHPKAFNWYKKLIIENMIGIGMSGWMADFGEYLPTDAVIYEGNPEEIHNIWPTLWAKCNHEAIIESGVDDLFFFSRAAYTNTLKYTNALWSGDQHVDYSKAYGLQSVVPSMLSMSTTGIGVSHSDIGGYTTILHMKRDKELFMRWSELNVFTPLFRTHEGNKPWLNVQYDHIDVIDHFKKMTHIFARLSPYLSDMKKIYAQTGLPVIRPVFYHDDDQAFYLKDNVYMYGSDIICYPVLKPNIRKHQIYLPKGDWIHMFTMKKYHAGIHEVDVPIGTPSVFYLENSSYQALFETIK